MNELQKVNHLRRREAERLRDSLVARWEAERSSARPVHPLAQLREAFSTAFAAASGRAGLAVQVDLIDREKFGGDAAVRLVDLLSELGAREYVRTIVPQLAEALRSPELASVVADVQTKGIYVNIRLHDRWLLGSVAQVVDAGEAFGVNTSQGRQTFLIDYSAPNVAKVLHAGHIRSTIIGHVLANLHEACGARVYRVNHINDFGGFGFMLEGFRRFAEQFPADMRPADRLLEIYAIRRALERHVAPGTELADMPSADRDLIGRYLPEVSTPAQLRWAFADYTRASDHRFSQLEQGDPEEVALWTAMVEWSLTDFRWFYDALGIHIDFTLGESFYFDAGNAVVEEALAAGTAIQFTREHAAEAITRLDRAVEAGAMADAERDKRREAITKDVGAVVVPISESEQYVVRREDGRSIYATRDLGAVKIRREIFGVTDLVYVVGQEQQVHFSRLFAAARVIGLAPEGEVRFRHVYFGFYVDAHTGKKLSSRDSVSGVNRLLQASVDYFRARCAQSGGQTDEELDLAAHQLAVGSLVFNDLKQDMKGSVDVDTRDVMSMIEAFERSGGAYVVYAACRARSILRKYGRPLPTVDEVPPLELSGQEVALILRLLELPDRVARAAEAENPSVLVRWLLDLAGLYNSYYNVAPVLKDGQANLFRLLLTRAAELALANGLRVCHVECPPKI